MVFEHQGEYPSQWTAICVDRREARGASRDGCASGCVVPRSMTGAGLGSRPTSGPGSRNSSVRTASCAAPTRSSSRRRLSSRPSSTVEPGSDRLHRRAPRTRSGSSRSAARCSSPRARTARRRRGRPSARARARRGAAVARSLGCIARTSGSTARTRCGPSSTAKASRVARCTVERLMRELGLRGAVRGKTAPHHDRRRPPRCGRGIWSIATSPRRRRTGSGSRTSPTCGPGPGSSTSRSSPTCTRGMIVGWQASRSLRTDLALDALEQAIWSRQRAGHDLDRARPSQRSRRAISRDSLHRTPRRQRRRQLGRLSRRQLRQRARRDASSGSTRPNSSATKDPGAASTTSSSPPSNGSTGSTTAASSRPRPHPTRRVRSDRYYRQTTSHTTEAETHTREPAWNPGRFRRDYVCELIDRSREQASLGRDG